MQLKTKIVPEQSVESVEIMRTAQVSNIRVFAVNLAHNRSKHQQPANKKPLGGPCFAWFETWRGMRAQNPHGLKSIMFHVLAARRKPRPSTRLSRYGSARGPELPHSCYKRPMRLLHDYAPRPAHLKWLLDSDPAIRWQVMRDLTREAPDAIAAERSRVATEGWGAQLLRLQSPAGSWGGPKEDRGLLITLYSLVALKDLGLDPASKQARKMIDRVDKRLVFKPLNNQPFLHGETEPCINGRILALGAYFKEPNDALAKQLLSEQLEDGGWNCEAQLESPKRPKSRRSSFHTTICVLEGLLDYERAGRKSAAVTKARKRAENYLLERRMFRSLRTGEVIDQRWLRFSYPTFWHYDVLRGLDYLQNAGIKPDSRVREAIEIVIERCHQNGRWPLNLLHREHIPLEIETAVGSASRWNTLRALRVLRWYNNAM